MAKSGVTYYYNLPRFARAFADEVRGLAAVEVRAVARRTVAVDTSRLRNSIRIDQVTEDTEEVSANTPYAAAQEYGRPDLPRYTFTPFMRPAAAETRSKMPAIARKAVDQALRDSKA